MLSTYIRSNMLEADSGSALQTASIAELQGPLPPELWASVLSKSDYATLKCARKVNSIFRELSTPLLFDHIVYSVDEKSIRNLRLLAKNDQLSKHVRRMYLDTASYRQGLDTRRYSQLTASYFQSAFELPMQENGPLSEQALLKVLRADPVEDLGKKFLSGVARRAYVTGFTTYTARSDYYQEQLEDDGVYKQLKDLIPKFANLIHLETMTVWSGTSSRKRFEEFLRRTLPANSLDLIPGLMNSTTLPPTSKSPIESPYCAPGQTSRRLNPLTPPPNFSGCWGVSTAFDVLTAALRALHECKPKLESLSLPGSDDLGNFVSIPKRLGIIPVPALVVVPRSTPKASNKTLLLPLFENLKSLELKLDFAHPGTQVTYKHHVDPNRLCTALQKMKRIERLSLGAVDCPEEAQSAPWSLYETLLRSEKDDKDILPGWSAELDDGDEDYNYNNGTPPPGFPDMTLAMIAASLGIPPPPGTLGDILVAPPVITSTPATPPFTTAAAGAAAGTPSASNTPIGPPPIPTPQTPLPTDDPSPKIHPSTALRPNPWPKLQHLHLFNMPTTKEDLSRLTLTVAPTLTSLTLNRVYIDDFQCPPDPSTTSPSTLLTSFKYQLIAPSWLETLTLIGNKMKKLTSANITLTDRDIEFVVETLIENIPDAGDVRIDYEGAINKYITDEDARGLDFASYVASLAGECERMDQDSDDEDEEEEDEWEDEDDDDSYDDGYDGESTDEEMPDLIA